MKSLFFQIMSGLNFINNSKNKNMKNYKKLFCIEDKTKTIRYILSETKFEALERIKGQDDYKFPNSHYKISNMNSLKLAKNVKKTK